MTDFGFMNQAGGGGSTDFNATKNITGAYYPFPVKKGTKLCVADGGRLVPWWANMPMASEIRDAIQAGLMSVTTQNLTHMAGQILGAWPVGGRRVAIFSYGNGSYGEGDNGLHCRVLSEADTTGAPTFVDQFTYSTTNNYQPKETGAFTKVHEDANYHYFFTGINDRTVYDFTRISKTDGSISVLAGPTGGLSHLGEAEMWPLLYRSGATNPRMLFLGGEVHTAADVYSLDIDLEAWTIGPAWTADTFANHVPGSTAPVSDGVNDTCWYDQVNRTGYFYDESAGLLYEWMYDPGTDTVTEATREFGPFRNAYDEGTGNVRCNGGGVFQVSDKIWKFTDDSSDAIGFVQRDDHGEIRFIGGVELCWGYNQLKGGATPLVDGDASFSSPGCWDNGNDIGNGLLANCFSLAWPDRDYFQTPAGVFDSSFNVLPTLDQNAYWRALRGGNDDYGRLSGSSHVAVYILEEIDADHVWAMLVSTNSTTQKSCTFFRAPRPCFQMSGVVGVATSDSDANGNFNATIFESLADQGDADATITYDGVEYPAHWIRGNFSTKNLSGDTFSESGNSYTNMTVAWNSAAFQGFSQFVSLAFEHGVIEVDDALSTMNAAAPTGMVFNCGRHLVIRPSSLTNSNTHISVRYKHV